MSFTIPSLDKMGERWCWRVRQIQFLIVFEANVFFIIVNKVLLFETAIKMYQYLSDTMWLQASGVCWRFLYCHWVIYYEESTLRDSHILTSLLTTGQRKQLGDLHKGRLLPVIVDARLKPLLRLFCSIVLSFLLFEQLSRGWDTCYLTAWSMEAIHTPNWYRPEAVWTLLLNKGVGKYETCVNIELRKACRFYGNVMILFYIRTVLYCSTYWS